MGMHDSLRRIFDSFQGIKGEASFFFFNAIKFIRKAIFLKYGFKAMATIDEFYIGTEAAILVNDLPGIFNKKMSLINRGCVCRECYGKAINCKNDQESNS